VQKIGFNWKAQAAPTEFLSISKENGVKMRATISEFGPVLLNKILELNDTQGGLVSMVFKYCDDKKLPLLDIKDFRKALQHVNGEGKDEVQNAYGLVSTASVGAVLRKLLEIEEQGADLFFGEPSFEVQDLIRLDENGRGYISMLRLADIQSKPKLFSSFMLSLLSEIYQTFPERGDKDNPELVIFIDEAHLIFDEASKTLLDEIETIIKLIRSKGVGIYFCTQNPTDVPDAILSQLGMKIQHALRAFTAKDRDSIRKTAENYPETTYYKTEDLLTQLGIGEALITVLNDKGIPTPLVHTMMVPPQSRMDVITPAELDAVVSASALAKKYNQEIDRESAYEILTQKINPVVESAPKETESRTQEEKAPEEESKAAQVGAAIAGVAKSKVFNTVMKEVTRGLLGALVGKPSRRRSGGGLFGF
jgi:hypothetical protein